MSHHRTREPRARRARSAFDRWHQHWHDHLDYDHRARRRRPTVRGDARDELEALEAYRRDIEQRLADVSEEIRRVREARGEAASG